MRRGIIAGTTVTAAAVLFGTGQGINWGENDARQNINENIAHSIALRTSKVEKTVDNLCLVNESTYIDALISLYGINKDDISTISLNNFTSRVNCFSALMDYLKNKVIAKPNPILDNLTDQERFLLLAGIFSSGCMPSGDQNNILLQTRDQTLVAFNSALDSLSCNQHLLRSDNPTEQQIALNLAHNTLFDLSPVNLNAEQEINSLTLLKEIVNVLTVTHN